MLGGSLTQILVPLIFVGHFWLHYDRWSASLLLYWVADSIDNVAYYAADAQKMQLDLLGGDGVIHGNYLLSHLHLLQYTLTVSLFIYTVGAVLALVVCSLFLRKQRLLSRGVDITRFLFYRSRAMEYICRDEG